MFELEPVYYAGMRGPLSSWRQHYPAVRDDAGALVVDFTGAKLLRVQAVRPDGLLGPAWASDAASPLGIVFENVTAESFDARHEFRADVDELPWLAQIAQRNHESSQVWSFRHSLTVNGIAVQMAATCLRLRNPLLCPC